MLSGCAVFRWCEPYVGMLVSHWFLHLAVPADLFWRGLLGYVPSDCMDGWRTFRCCFMQHDLLDSVFGMM